MEFLGERLVMRLGGLPVPVAAIVLVVAYVALHYLFVSQTAQLLALFGVFLGVGVKLGVSRATARVSTALRDELFRGDGAAGLERESAVRLERLHHAGRALQARRPLHRVLHRALSGHWDAVADARCPVNGFTSQERSHVITSWF